MGTWAVCLLNMQTMTDNSRMKMGITALENANCEDLY